MGDRDSQVSHTNHSQNLFFLTSLVEQMKVRLFESASVSQFVPATDIYTISQTFHISQSNALSSFINLHLEIDDNFRFLFSSLTDTSKSHVGQTIIIKPIDGIFDFMSLTNDSNAIIKYTPPYFLVSQNSAKTTVIVDNKGLSCIAILDIGETEISKLQVVETFEHSISPYPNQCITFRIEDRFGNLIKCDEKSFFMIKLFQ